MQIGKGSLNQLPEIIRIIGSIKSLLIVTDKQMVKFGYVKKLQELLTKEGFKSNVFDETIPDPTDTVVLDGIKILNKNKNDAVIGFGGGSQIDTAKAIAVLSQHSENIQDYKPPGTFDKKGLYKIPGNSEFILNQFLIGNIKLVSHEKQYYLAKHKKKMFLK